jgi:AAA+ superfamily predicted ATPase
MTRPSSELFDEVVKFPNPAALKRYNGLVGLDDVKRRVTDFARLVAEPLSLDKWAKKHKLNEEFAAQALGALPRLLVFGGDVGTGKTALGVTIGAAIASRENIPVTLHRLSLRVRGTGIVGEMTKLLGDAFAEVRAFCSVRARGTAKASGMSLLLVDEADALAQSRTTLHMHHEDRAGVNALIRGIDDVTIQQLPVVVLLCTNRVEALDPAVRRRAFETFVFLRPDADRCEQVLASSLASTGLTRIHFRELAKAIGPRDGRLCGFTYSDIVQRYIPQLVIAAASADKPVTFDDALALALAMQPTPPFEQDRP